MNIARLYELQKTDTTWEKVRRRLIKVRGQLVESEDLKARRQQLAEIQSEQQHWQALQRNSELEAQSLAQRIKATDERLMSGQVRNPKELESLQASLDALRRQRDSVENQGVEALLKMEELTAAVEAARAALADSDNKWKANQAELIGEETKLKKLFVQCKRQRETLAASLGADLPRYEDLRQRKGGVAVAALEGTMCAACHVQVPTGVASSARHENGAPVLCPSCGRILYAG